MTEAPRRGWRCPSSQQIAAYLDQRLEEKDRERLEAHLADCDFCISLVGSLTRQQDGGDKTEPSPILLRQAIDSVPARRSAGWGWRWAVAPALAALVAASAVLLRSPEPPASRSAEVAAPAMETPAETPVPKESSPARRSARPTVRSLQPPPSELQVLDPQSGSVLAASDLVIRWKPAADVAYYEVRVADAEGDSVWRTESVASQARVPSAVDLSPGKYFVIVHAHLKDGRTLKSEAVPFRIKAHG